MAKKGLVIKSEPAVYSEANSKIMSQETLIESGEQAVSVEYLRSTYGRDIWLPVEIFSGSLSALQAIVKYAREACKLSNAEAARRIGRKPNTVWSTYRHVKNESMPRKYVSKIFIPVSIFRDEKLSALEALITFLRAKGLANARIADLLKRDSRTVWTVYSRAKAKGKMDDESG
jgi:DNA-binding CsgD family transcriptional regulator